MAEWTLSDVERLSALNDADRTFQMSEDAFRVVLRADVAAGLVVSRPHHR